MADTSTISDDDLIAQAKAYGIKVVPVAVRKPTAPIDWSSRIAASVTPAVSPPVAPMPQFKRPPARPLPSVNQVSDADLIAQAHAYGITVAPKRRTPAPLEAQRIATMRANLQAQPQLGEPEVKYSTAIPQQFARVGKAALVGVPNILGGLISSAVGNPTAGNVSSSGDYAEVPSVAGSTSLTDRPIPRRVGTGEAISMATGLPSANKPTIGQTLTAIPKEVFDNFPDHPDETILAIAGLFGIGRGLVGRTISHAALGQMDRSIAASVAEGHVTPEVATTIRDHIHSTLGVSITRPTPRLAPPPPKPWTGEPLIQIQPPGPRNPTIALNPATGGVRVGPGKPKPTTKLPLTPTEPPHVEPTPAARQIAQDATQGPIKVGDTVHHPGIPDHGVVVGEANGGDSLKILFNGDKTPETWNADIVRRDFDKVTTGKAPDAPTVPTKPTPAPAPVAATTPIEPTAAPGTPAAVQPAEAVPNAPTGPRMAGSVNLDRTDLPEDAKARLEQTANDLGTNDKPSVSHDERSASSAAQGLQFHHIENLDPGEYPAGVKTQEQRLNHENEVRNLNNRYTRLASDAETAYRDAPTSENKAAFDEAQRKHRVTLLHDDAFGQESGRGLEQRKMQSYSHEAQVEGDLFRTPAAEVAPANPIAKVLKRTGKGKNAGTAAPDINKAGFGDNAKVFKKEAFTPAMTRIRARFKDPTDLTDCAS